MDRADADASLALNADFTAKLTGRWPTGRSSAAAIRRKCIDCVCGQIELIADCQIRNCALWPYRIHRRLAARFLECAKRHQDKAAKIRGLWL